MYYIYIWYVISTSEVFYVGRGHGNRYKTLKKRSKHFHKFYDNFECNSKIIVNNLTEKEAIEKEKEYIAYYRNKGMAKANIHNGGTIGGNVITHLPDEDKTAFIEKMTIINTARCQTTNFKEQARKNMIERYKNPNEREKQALRQQRYWTDENRQKQSERIRQIASENPEMIRQKAKKLQKPCILEYNGEIQKFNSLKELEIFLQEIYDFKITNRYKKQDMLYNKTPFTTNRHKLQKFVGLKIYYVV